MVGPEEAVATSLAESSAEIRAPGALRRNKKQRDLESQKQRIDSSALEARRVRGSEAVRTGLAKSEARTRKTANVGRHKTKKENSEAVWKGDGNPMDEQKGRPTR